MRLVSEDVDELVALATNAEEAEVFEDLELVVVVDVWIVEDADVTSVTTTAEVIVAALVVVGIGLVDVEIIFGLFITDVDGIDAGEDATEEWSLFTFEDVEILVADVVVATDTV